MNSAENEKKLDIIEKILKRTYKNIEAEKMPQGWESNAIGSIKKAIVDERNEDGSGRPADVFDEISADTKPEVVEKLEEFSQNSDDDEAQPAGQLFAKFGKWFLLLATLAFLAFQIYRVIDP